MRAKARAGVLLESSVKRQAGSLQGFCKPFVKPQSGSLQEAKFIPLSSARLKSGVSWSAPYRNNGQAEAWRSMRAKARAGVLLESSVKPQAGSLREVFSSPLSSARLKPGVSWSASYHNKGMEVI